MRRSISLLIVAAALPLAGCSAARPAEPEREARAVEAALPGMEGMSAAERAEVFERGFRRQLGPGARVGVVAAVDAATVQVGDLDTSGLKAGDELMFMDAAGRAVALGRIASVDGKGASATFDATLVQDGRPPRGGDMAVFNLQSAKP